MKLDVSNKKILVAGDFSRQTRAEIRDALLDHGAQLVETLDEQPAHIFAGTHTQALCEQALQRHIPVLTEHALLNILGISTRARPEKLFPSGENLALSVNLAAQPRTYIIPLPEVLSDHTLTLSARPTSFITSRRFGETWGLKLSEYDTHALGQLIWDDAPMFASPLHQDVEHLYYCRFRSDGSDYASGSEKFSGVHGFHANWLMERLEEGIAPTDWQRLGDEEWLLKLSAHHQFGHVVAEEYEELVIHTTRAQWRWSHYFLPVDEDM